ncbi:MAG: hypothetical protein IH851_11055, partial [Armatimonadetes bacterium]|nr:hypothetical protein [Armatimonadota bacterium]
MFASALVCLCVAGSFVATDSIEIPIKHRRPTKIMQLLLLDGTDTGFMPEGVSANANDAGRLIVAKGPAKGLDEFRELIALFDKLPSTIKVRVVVDSVYDAED